MIIFGEAEALYLYYTWGIKLVIQRKAQESVGLSRNEPETSAEAQTLSEQLRVSGIPNPWGPNVFVARRGKPILEPPTCTAFGNRVAKSGIPFQTQL